ncbi:MAG: A24 family peptidase [Bacteroidota bacterium]
MVSDILNPLLGAGLAWLMGAWVCRHEQGGYHFFSMPLAALLAWVFVYTGQPAANAIVTAAVLSTATSIDARSSRIPNRLMGAALFLGLVLLPFQPEPLAALLAALAGIVALVGVRGLGYWIAGQPGMGWGDVKLAGTLGLLLGWSALWVLYLGVLVGGSAVLIGVMTRRVSRQMRVPFAPMVTAGAACLWMVPALLRWGGWA